MHEPAAVAATTREQLLTVAADLLQRVGYASFSFRDLAEAVGIRAASVHYHFPTKADLGVALVDWFRAQSDPQMTALCQAYPNVRDRLMSALPMSPLHANDSHGRRMKTENYPK